MLLKIDNNKKIINFHFQPKKSCLNSWAKSLTVVEFSKVKFFGVVKQKTRSRWELVGQLSFEVLQECVVTLDPVTAFINCEIKRVYLENYSLENNQGSLSRLQELEFERLEDTIDLKNLIFEELSLNTPEYPKLKHIEKIHKLPENLNTSDGTYKNNPFGALKNFEVKNKVKTN